MNEEVRRLQAPPVLWDELRVRAREMRRDPTPAEQRLWAVLRRMRPGGPRFRRQHAIGQFIVDFYCVQAQLVIEVDGPIHEATVEQDGRRSEFLESLGLRVLRFTHEEILHEIARVERVIEEHASRS